MILKIYPDSALRQTSTIVSDINNEINNLIENMTEFMVFNKGIGLAAPQVGIRQRIVIVQNDNNIISLINPRIVETYGEVFDEEGCLSLPGIWLEIERCQSTLVQYIDQKGNEVQREFDGLSARIIRHEIDHLNGVLIIDYASTIVKSLIDQKYASLDGLS